MTGGVSFLPVRRPAAPAAAATAPAAPAAPVPPAGPVPTACVVLVGQETLLSVGLATCLQQIEGLTVIRVDSVPAARRVAASRPVDVVLVDGEEVAEVSASSGARAAAGSAPAPRAPRLGSLDSSTRVADVVAHFSRLLPSRRRSGRAAAPDGPVPAPEVTVPGSRDGHDRSYTFSDREREVLQLASVGQPNGTIARALGLSEATVKTYWQRIFEKVGTRDRTGAVATAMATGLILGPARRMPTIHST